MLLSITNKLASFVCQICLFVALLFPIAIVDAQVPVSDWNAENSDPVQLGWMQGSPPTLEKTIRGTEADFFAFPKLRWSVCNFQQLMPSVEITRLNRPPVVLKRQLDTGIDQLTFVPMGGEQPMSWQNSLASNFTDGIIILHKGVIVYERYFGCLNQHNKHAAMSVTKSLVGLTAQILVAEGKLDDQKSVGSIIPELKDSGFGNATVRQVMDMTTSFKYSEDYSDPQADVWVYSAAGSPFPKPKNFQGPTTYYDYLKTVQGDGEHGKAFAYKTPNTDVLGWVISRVTGKPFAQLLSERIWSRIGAEQSAFITVDSIGTPFVGGGFNCGLRDLARVGQLMLNEGVMYGERIFPKSVVEHIRRGGSQAKFKQSGFPTLKSGSYTSMWWVFHNKNGAFAARGVHGQTIYVDPTAEMVIARFASHPEAKNGRIDPKSLPAYEAVAEYLGSR